MHLKAPENAAARSSVFMSLEQGTPTIAVEIEGVLRRLILDSGSNVSILQPGVSGSDVSVATVKPYGVTGEVLEIKGRQLASFHLNGHEFHHSFLVCTLPTEAAGLLGTDFMEKVGAEINFGGGKMSFNSTEKIPRIRSIMPTEQVALTVFSEGKEGRNPKATQRREIRIEKQVTTSPRPEVPISQDESWLVKATENITMAPRCRLVVLGRLEAGREQRFPH